MDAARYYATRESAGNVARFDALPEYATSPLFTHAGRAALDDATELTRDKKVDPGTFARLRQHYSKREICDIVWLASEHLYNMTNVGLNIGSDGLVRARPGRGGAASRPDRPVSPRPFHSVPLGGGGYLPQVAIRVGEVPAPLGGGRLLHDGAARHLRGEDGLVHRRA
jgi:hypothetical protein